MLALPRHTKPPRSRRRTTTKPDGGDPRVRRRAKGPELDGRALTLRDAGSSFTAIARMLGLDRAADAHRCFLPVLHGCHGEERRHIAGREQARLDALERRIRERGAGDPNKIARRLKGVTKLREAMVE